MGDLRSVAQNCLQVRVPGHRHPRRASPQARWESAKDTRRMTIFPEQEEDPVDEAPRRTNKARAEPVAVAGSHEDPEREKHGRPVVVVMVVVEYERLKFFKTGHVASRPSTTGKAE